MTTDNDAEQTVATDTPEAFVRDHYSDGKDNGSQLPEAPENPLECDNYIAPGVAEKRIAHEQITAQVEECRKAYRRVLHSYFELGREIIKLRDVMEQVNGKTPGRAELAAKLGLPMSEERISQIVLTTEVFGNNADEDIDFKVYEVARTMNNRSLLKRGSDELSQLVKNNPTTAKLKKAIEESDAIITVAVRKDAVSGLYRMTAFPGGNADYLTQGIACLLIAAGIEEKAEEVLKNATTLRFGLSELDAIDGGFEKYREAVARRFADICKRLGDERTLEALQDRFDVSNAPVETSADDGSAET